jgi:hypothetical protein
MYGIPDIESTVPPDTHRSDEENLVGQTNEDG